MVVGVLQTEIYIPGVVSLKEKRMALKSLKDRIRKKYNVSVAETGYQEKWQRAHMVFALVGTSEAFVQEALNKLFSALETEQQFEIMNFRFEFL